MDGRRIDLRKSVYRLCADDPALIGVIAAAGFPDIARPGMLSTAGRFMTLPKGAKLRGIDPKDIERVFEQHGYGTEGEWT